VSYQNLGWVGWLIVALLALGFVWSLVQTNKQAPKLSTAAQPGD